MADDYLTVASEIRELEGLLNDIPAENVIERMSLESRLEEAREALASLSRQSTQKVRLTFRGKPVFGSHGITADFGSKAASAFSDAFAAVAASLGEGLRDMGPIPNRDKNQLLITGIAVGSFGFEFELPVSEGSLFPEEEKAQEALTRIEELFRLAAEGTDDDVAEVIEEVHPRAVKKVYEFLDLLVQQEAWCALEFDERIFQYADHAQIRASSERLKSDNIQESEEIYRGEFQGVLPMGRTFEFQPADKGSDLIRGKIGPGVEDPNVLNRNWLHKPVAVKLSLIQVGQGRPRFTLMLLDDISE